MLHNLKGEKVEVILGTLDAVDGDVIDVEQGWLKLRKKNKVHLVQIDKVRRIICNYN